jgi:serine/threonine protein kinase
MQGGPEKVLGDSMFLQTSCGSPNYAAPEIVSGVEYDGFQVDNFFYFYFKP